MKFFIATKNKHKLIELERILVPMGFEVFSANEIHSDYPDVEETGLTFAENALIKARAGVEFTGVTTVADDSGLCVDYLGGEPGVFSARYAGEPADDNKNIELLLKNLIGVPFEKRTAKFVSTIACVFPDGREFTVSGECKGYIAEYPEGDGGFGYDPVFISEKGCVAKLTPEEKDSISHRGKSIKLFAEKLTKYL